VRVDMGVPFVLRRGLMRYGYDSYAAILRGKRAVFCKLASPREKCYNRIPAE